MAITTDRLLRGVKRRITNPANNQLMGDTDFLEMADDVMRDRLVPLLKGLSGSYLLATPTQTSIVGGQDVYDIPYRAMGRKLRNVKYSEDGTADSIRDLTLLDDDKIQDYAVDGVPQGFFYYSDQIVIRPKPTDSEGYLEFWWYLTKSCLVQTTAAARLISPPSSGSCSVASVPSTIVAGTTIDFVQGKSGNRVLGLDVSVTNVASSTISFATSDIPTSLTTGDYIALSQETPVLQIPDEAYPLLETALGARILYSLGDYEGSKALEDTIPNAEKNLRMILDPRTDQAPIKIVNRHGLLRGRPTMFRGVFFA